MLNEQLDVVKFMTLAGQECPDRPTLDVDTVLRATLIEEELEEYGQAVLERNLTKVADAITDLLYVVLGAAVAHGINIQPCWDEVHRSNMSKFIDGHRAPNGKWIKGPSYSPTRLERILKQQSE